MTSNKAAAARILSREQVFKRFRRLDLITLEAKSLRHDGYNKPMEREVLMTGKVSVVLPYVAETDEILLVRQFRVGAFMAQSNDPFLYEIPAGFIDDGETAEETARRELHEETGAELEDLEYVFHYHPSPGGTSEDKHLFVARIKRPETGFFGLQEESEEIETRLVKTDDALRMADAGEITNGTALVGIYWFARHKDRLRKKWGIA